MKMPAYNLKQPLSKNQLIKATSKQFNKSSINDEETIKSNITKILDNPKVSSVVERLSKI